MFSTVVLVIFVLFVLIIKYAKSKPSGFPPGPPWLPIWGSYWFLLAGDYKFPHLTIDKMGRYYETNILGFYLGSVPTVVTLDYETTQELLTRPEFQGRIFNYVTRLRAFGKNLGIFFTEGPFWLEQRRFALRHMRDFGFGRRSPVLESVVMEEIQDLIELLKIGSSNEFDKSLSPKINHALLPNLFYVTLNNIFWQVLAGERFPRNDNKSQQDAVLAVLNFQRSGDPTGGALTITPWWRHFAPNLSAYVPVKENNEKLQHFIQDSIKKHVETFSEDYDRDFIDAYIREMKKRKKENPDEFTSFTEEQLILSCVDFFIPSIAAGGAILGFIFMHLLHNPKIQTKIQEEIDTVVGKDRLPSLDDRPRMPYTEATIREGMRRESLNPLGFARKCTEDTTLGGYLIPKGTQMFAGMWSVHMSPELWGDPENFRPERFITEDGKLVKRDLSVPFGGGRRVCVGETFSRQNMFLIFSALLQNFTFTVPDGHELPDLNYHSFENGVNVKPKEFLIQAKPR